MHLRPYTIIMSSKTIPCAACCRGGIDVGVPIGPCRMKIRLILKEILPFYFRLVVLAAVTLFIDLILHLTDLVWIGRYLGIPGVILILLSFGHSLRKRGVIKSSNPRSEEHTSELQSLMRISYAVFCLKKTNQKSLLYIT